MVDKANFIIRKQKGETIFKKPGSLNGYDFIIEDCQDCEIYILDHTSQIQIDDCINCKIFIGPIAGSAFFRDCKDCQVEVACQQLRTRDMHSCTIGLYCSTKPIIETSTNIHFRCWMGAYPGLSGHFAATNLDPLANTWNEIYDFNQGEDLGAQHFDIIPESDYPTEFWQVTPPADEDGTEYGPCENPVMLPDGRTFGAAEDPFGSAEAPATPARAEEDFFGESAPAPAPAASEAVEDLFGAPAPAPPAAAAPIEDDFFGAPAAPVAVADLPPQMDLAPAAEDPFGAAAAAATGADVEVVLDDEDEPPLQDAGLVNGGGFAAPGSVLPAVSAEASAVLEAKRAEEAAGKAALRSEAAEFLLKFYGEREASKDRRMANNREVEAASVADAMGAAPSGPVWDRVISLIDFSLTSGSADLQRFKSSLFSAKQSTRLNMS